MEGRKGERRGGKEEREAGREGRERTKERREMEEGKERNEGGRGAERDRAEEGRDFQVVKGEGWNRSGKVICGVRWWGYLSGYHCGGKAGARAPIPRFVTNGSPLPNRGTTLQGLSSCSKV